MPGLGTRRELGQDVMLDLDSGALRGKVILWSYGQRVLRQGSTSVGGESVVVRKLFDS